MRRAARPRQAISTLMNLTSLTSLVMFDDAKAAILAERNHDAGDPSRFFEASFSIGCEANIRNAEGVESCGRPVEIGDRRDRPHSHAIELAAPVERRKDQ